MKNFKWTSLSREIAVKAKLSVLYDAWTKASEIEKWFLSKSVFYDRNNNDIGRENKIEKGFTYEWGWYLYDVTETGKIIEANNKDNIQFTFAGNCLVDMRLKEVENYVFVNITQSNIPTDDDSKLNIRLGCDSGWLFYLLNLKSVYEGGLDLRNKDVRLKPMVNN